jgi:hypothetical protein
MASVLCSAPFLFLQEPPTLPTDLAEYQLIDESALAARLSYFLWSSPPDAALSRLANQGKLRAEIFPELKRMLRDTRIRHFAQNFAGQWLQWRNISAATQSQPETLRSAMQAETEAFFLHLLHAGRPVREFIDADYTFTNATLAEWYGMAGPTRETMEKTSLRATGRRGVLGQSGFLALTSHAERTSPVMRGKWILENMLGMSPPPPPPNVPTLERVQSTTQDFLSQLAAHRSDAKCASCHAALDPLGLALEPFDSAGRWRTVNYDTATELIDGTRIRSPIEISSWIVQNHLDDFREHLASSLLAYARGAPVTPTDLPQVREIVRVAAEHGDSLGGYLWGVIRSVSFQTRLHSQ